MTTPLEHYRRDIAEHGFFEDAAQRRAVEALQQVFDGLAAERRRHEGLLGRFRRPRAVPGLYMWGGVGRGKTYLMDVFYDALPAEGKLRMHFHRFMQYVHRQMRARQGEKNPLESIGDELADQARVLCFDEFFVTDITDAMILAGLMDVLFRRSMTLVATSNIHPDHLYYNGLQRQRFLPAIDRIKDHCRVLNVDGGVDYRLRVLEQAALFHHPLGDEAEAFLEERFRALAPEHGEPRDNVDLDVEGRAIRARRVDEDVAWFDFRELCDGPRSQNDYIELAREFHAVLVANVEQLGKRQEDMARRFINLVDEFYDRGVKLILTAESSIEELYQGDRLTFEFERTRSRLLEMQSHDYLGREHQA
jgi:cell division protein ZapE